MSLTSSKLGRRRWLILCGFLCFLWQFPAFHCVTQPLHADSEQPSTNARPLTVCAIPTAMPRTGKAPDGTPQGLDSALAQLLGRSLGRKIEFHWCAGPACAWNCLRENRCDVVLGMPHDSGPPRDLGWSVP